jgi:putative ABC transport system permease protein
LVRRARLVVAIYLIQVMLIAGFGVFLGLLLGLATPFLPPARCRA